MSDIFELENIGYVSLIYIVPTLAHMLSRRYTSLSSFEYWVWCNRGCPHTCRLRSLSIGWLMNVSAMNKSEKATAGLHNDWRPRPQGMTTVPRMFRSVVGGLLCPLWWWCCVLLFVLCLVIQWTTVGVRQSTPSCRQFKLQLTIC